jgi:dCTP deaminase
MSKTLFEEEPGKNSTILSDKEILDYVNRGSLITKDTFSQSCLEASSYDIRVGAKGIIGGEGSEIDLATEKSMEIPPGAYAAIISFEKMNFPRKISARLGSKRALSYEGIILLTGSIVDPGYEGHLLFGLYNASQKKVHIRFGRKICNIVFEKLAIEPEKEVSPEPNLLHGNFPDSFLDKMANMDVLPWMQISERVKQIENITKDIIDLKVKYEDVLKPIKDLTDSVKSLSQTVQIISDQTKNINADLEKANDLINENGKQISQLTHNLSTLSQNQQLTTQSINAQENKINELTVGMKGQAVWSKILGAIALLVLGALLSWVFAKFLK